MYLFGSHEPWMFALCLFPATMMGSCVRTPGANLMLEQQEEDTGSDVALMSRFGVLMGSMGMGGHLLKLGRYGEGAGGHECTSGGRMSGIVGAFGWEALCQADS